ncbi:MAG: BatA and WFA domain-containing protein [Candidatus Binataceae bacterium]|jgi:hypothetical protein
MGFLNPLNLLYGLSLVALVLIYLHARSRLTLDVSSLMLFDEVEQPIAKPRVARIDLLFWLEMATLATLSLAVAGLYLKLRAAPQRIRSHALIFDTAAGMGARDGDRTRLDQAKREASAIVSAAAAGDQFSVISYAQEAGVRLAASGDPAAIRAAIESLGANAVAQRPAALNGALMLAREADSADLFADRLPSGAAQGGVVTSRLRFHRVGSGADNLAIVSLDPGVPGLTQGRCVIRNFSADAHVVQLAIDCDGREAYHSAVSVAARGQAIVPFGPLANGGLLHARLLTPDALAADNDRWSYATASRSFHVLVVSPDAGVRDDLTRVVRAIDPNFVIADTDPAHLKELASSGAHFDLALMHDIDDSVGPHADSRLLIYPARARELSLGASIPYCEMAERTDGSRLSRAILLGAGRVVALPVWMQPLARGIAPGVSGTIPIAAIGTSGEGRLGVIAFDIRNHLLLDPDRLDALVLTVDLIKALAVPQGLYIAPTGIYVSLPAAGHVQLIAPDGVSTPLSADQWGQLRFRPMQAGRYQVISAGRVQQVFTNYYDGAESDLELKPVTIRATEAGAGGSSAFTTLPSVRPVGLALIALATIAFLAESALMAARGMLGRRLDV